MIVFTKEVRFLSKVFDTQSNQWIDGKVTKQATFKELDQRDKGQHKLHFKLVSLFKSGEVDGEMELDSDHMYEVTVRAVKSLLITDKTYMVGESEVTNPSNFTKQDEAEFLNDSMGLVDFGMWLLQEKIAPFFQKSMER